MHIVGADDSVRPIPLSFRRGRRPRRPVSVRLLFRSVGADDPVRLVPLSFRASARTGVGIRFPLPPSAREVAARSADGGSDIARHFLSPSRLRRQPLTARALQRGAAALTGRRTPRAFVPLRSTAGRRPLRSVTAHAVGWGALTPPHKGMRIPTPVTRSLARNDSASRCSGGQGRPPLRPPVGDALRRRGRSMIRRAGPMCPAARYDLLSAGHAGSALQRVRQITRRRRCPHRPAGTSRAPSPAGGQGRPPLRPPVGDALHRRGRSMIRRAGSMCPAAQYALIPAGHAGPALQRGAANHP